MTNLEIITKICNLMGVSPEDSISFVKDRPGHDFRYSISNKKVSHVGLPSKTSNKVSLDRTIKYYRAKYEDNA